MVVNKLMEDAKRMYEEWLLSMDIIWLLDTIATTVIKCKQEIEDEKK